MAAHLLKPSRWLTKALALTSAKLSNCAIPAACVKSQIAAHLAASVSPSTGALCHISRMLHCGETECVSVTLTTTHTRTSKIRCLAHGHSMCTLIQIEVFMQFYQTFDMCVCTKHMHGCMWFRSSCTGLFLHVHLPISGLSSVWMKKQV